MPGLNAAIGSIRRALGNGVALAELRNESAQNAAAERIRTSEHVPRIVEELSRRISRDTEGLAPPDPRVRVVRLREGRGRIERRVIPTPPALVEVFAPLLREMRVLPPPAWGALCRAQAARLGRGPVAPGIWYGDAFGWECNISSQRLSVEIGDPSRDPLWRALIRWDNPSLEHALPVQECGAWA